LSNLFFNSSFSSLQTYFKQSRNFSLLSVNSISLSISSFTPLSKKATGGSALKAIEVLISHGVPPSRILFLNLVASPEGLKNVFDQFPEVRVVSAWVDEGLSEKNYSESARLE